MNNTSLTLLVLLFLTKPNILFAAPERFLCIADKTTGFAFINGSWQSTEFSADEKFILTKEPISKKRKEEFEDTVWKNVTEGYRIKEIGKETLGDWCSLSKYELYCDKTIRNFGFSIKSLRFIVSSPWGYWNTNDDEKSDTPFLMIGRCSVF